MPAAKHDWHVLDAERGLEVRQATNRLRRNRWEVRTAEGEILKLDDDEFDHLRQTPGLLGGGS